MQSSSLLVFISVISLQNYVSEGQIHLSLDTAKFNLQPLKEILKGMPALAGRSARMMNFITQTSTEHPFKSMSTDSSIVAKAIPPSSSSQTSSQGSCSLPVAYDTLMLALQWSPGLCHQTYPDTFCRRDKIVNSFTIHGLWPTSLDKKDNTIMTNKRKKRQRQPQFCCNHEPFNMTDALLSVKELEKIWPTLLKKNSNEQFLGHEWSKHGSCAYASSPHITSHSDYFKVASKLYNRSKILEWLSKDGIVPRNNSYETEEIHYAISRRINKSIIIQCRTVDKKPVLKEIRVCFSPFTLAFKDCGKKTQNCKGNRVVLVPK